MCLRPRRGAVRLGAPSLSKMVCWLVVWLFPILSLLSQ